MFTSFSQPSIVLAFTPDFHMFGRARRVREVYIIFGIFWGI